MWKRTLAAAVLAGAVVVAGAAIAAERTTQTFSGTYDWAAGGSDELSAEFAPDGDGAWKVSFRFRWQGSRRSWSGTAEGSLADGSRVTGTATSGNRNWEFEATIEDGVMRGSHTEIKSRGRRTDTGTFEIRR